MYEHRRSPLLPVRLYYIRLARHAAGSLVALKALPLVLAAPGILDGRRYTYQWSSMLVLGYFAEGVTRAWAERGISQSLALGEILLSVIFFAAAVSYARRTRAGA